MNIAKWIFGPQLIGIVLYIVGNILQRFPPKKINWIYGYRTASSMKNQQTWDEGNRFSARWMMRNGVWIFISGVLLVVIINTFITSPKTRSVILLVSLLFTTILSATLLLVKTEKYLNKTFNSEE